MEAKHYFILGYAIFVLLMNFIGYFLYGFKLRKNDYGHGDFGGMGVLLSLISFVSIVVMCFALFGDGDHTTTIKTIEEIRHVQESK